MLLIKWLLTLTMLQKPFDAISVAKMHEKQLIVGFIHLRKTELIQYNLRFTAALKF